MGVFFAAITWCLIVEFLGMLTFPLLSRGLSVTSDAASYLARPLGLFLFGYLVWLLSVTGITDFSRNSSALILIILFIAQRVCLKETSWEALKKSSIPFWSMFLLFLIICSFHPEIYWGEKPMDFTFLNFFTRTTTIPPMDPWAAGNTMLYYYGGTLLFAALHKLSGMPTQYGYWFSVALVQTMLFSAAAGILFLLKLKNRWAITGGALITLCGNMDTFYLMLTKPNLRSFDLYWATSRVLHTPGINEYALWSFIFADLHAHYIALPLSLLVLGLTIFLFSDECTHRFRTMVLLALCWAMLAFVNSWDFLTYGLVIGLFFLSKILTQLTAPGMKNKLIWCIYGVFALCGAVIFSLPFHLTVSGSTEIGWGYVNKEEFNNLGEVLRIHGHWIVLIFSSLMLVIYSIRRADVLFALLFGSVPFALGAYHVFGAKLDGIPWDILTFASIVCVCGAVWLRSCFAFGAICISLGILYSISELYYLMDRMNTTFKLYNALWSLGAIAALIKLPTFFSVPFTLQRPALFSTAFDTNENFETFENASNEIIHLSPFQRKTRQIINYISLVPLFVAICGGIYCIVIMSTYVRIPGPRPTLNGQAYLGHFNPVEQKAFDWINKNIKGTPVLVEAWGPSYQEYTRFSMHTGLPVVIGWEHHIKQRGTSHEDLMERKRAVEIIYSSSDLKQTQILLNKYRVDLIVVGRQERAAYPNAQFEKFDQHPALFPLLFSYDGGGESVKIYTTSYSSLRP